MYPSSPFFPGMDQRAQQCASSPLTPTLMTWAMCSGAPSWRELEVTHLTSFPTQPHQWWATCTCTYWFMYTLCVCVCACVWYTTQSHYIHVVHYCTYTKTFAKINPQSCLSGQNWYLNLTLQNKYIIHEYSYNNAYPLLRRVLYIYSWPNVIMHAFHSLTQCPSSRNLSVADSLYLMEGVAEQPDEPLVQLTGYSFQKIAVTSVQVVSGANVETVFIAGVKGGQFCNRKRRGRKENLCKTQKAQLSLNKLTNSKVLGL